MKRKFLILFVMFFAFVLVGCGDNKGTNDEDLLKGYLDKIFVNAEVEENFLLPRNIDNKDDHTISWESSDETVIKIGNIAEQDGATYYTAKVTVATEDKKAVLTATVELTNGLSAEKEFTVTVKGKKAEIPTGTTKISEVLGLAKDTKVENVGGKVVATNAQSFVLEDETGKILVYMGREWVHDVKAGTVLTLSGNVDEFNGCKQIKSAIYNVVSNGEMTQPAPKVLTGADVDKYATNTDVKIEYVQLTGVVSTSQNQDGTKTYYNLEINGASAVKGSITYPENAQEITALSGKTVEVKAYVTGTAGSGRFLNLMVTEIKETSAPTPTPTPGTKATIAEIKASQGGNYTTEGTVMGTNAQSFLISDGKDVILVYMGYDWTCDLVAGDKVSVTGAASVYSNAMQFGKGSTYTKLGSEKVTYPTAKVLTAADVDAYANQNPISMDYVSVTGTVKVTVDEVKGRTYYNFTIAGATVTGSITYPADEAKIKELDGQTVTLKAYVTGVAGKGRFLNLLVTEFGEGTAPKPVEVKTIAAIREAGAGTYATNGTVIAKNARSFIIKDETGEMLVYMGSEWDQLVNVGDTVKVTGAVSVYANAMQFGNNPTFEVTGTQEISKGTAEVIDAAKADEYLNNTDVLIKYVTVNGALTVAGGKYFNLAINGAKIVGSLTYPIDLETLNALNGEIVGVTGYITGVSVSESAGTAFLNIMVESFVKGEATATDKFAYAEKELNVLNGSNVRSNMTLPTTYAKYNLTVTWASNNETIIKADGTFTAPTADTEVKLTATVKDGETVLGTVEVTVTAKAAGTGEAGTPYTYTFADTSDLQNGKVTTLAGLDWRYTTDGGFQQFESGKGMHIGSNKAPAKNITLSTDAYDGKITKVTVNASSGSGAATIMVKVNGVATTAQTMTKTAADYTFTVEGTGLIEIIITNNAKAIYINSVSINK